MSRINKVPNVFNLAAYLLEGNLQRSDEDKVAFCDRERTYTYLQLNNLVRCSASLLAKLGVERENRVGILLPNCIESIVFFLGAMWLGAVPVAINPACSKEEINYILQDSRLKVLLTSQEWTEKLGLSRQLFVKEDEGTGGQGDEETGRRGDWKIKRLGDKENIFDRDDSSSSVSSYLHWETRRIFSIAMIAVLRCQVIYVVSYW